MARFRKPPHITRKPKRAKLVTQKLPKKQPPRVCLKDFEVPDPDVVVKPPAAFGVNNSKDPFEDELHGEQCW